jgi:hypothetical protein
VASAGIGTVSSECGSASKGATCAKNVVLSGSAEQENGYSSAVKSLKTKFPTQTRQIFRNFIVDSVRR